MEAREKLGVQGLVSPHPCAFLHGDEDGASCSPPFPGVTFWCLLPAGNLLEDFFFKLFPAFLLIFKDKGSTRGSLKSKVSEPVAGSCLERGER